MRSSSQQGKYAVSGLIWHFNMACVSLTEMEQALRSALEFISPYFQADTEMGDDITFTTAARPQEPIADNIELSSLENMDNDALREFTVI